MQTQPAQIEPSATSSSAGELRLVAVPPQHLAEVFPMVRDLMERVADRSGGRYSASGMLDKFLRGDWILWLVWDGTPRAIVGTELYLEMTGIKCCMIRFATGHGAKDWVPLLEQIEDWAREEGCTYVDCLARKGWARHLPDYRMSHVFLEKGL